MSIESFNLETYMIIIVCGCFYTNIILKIISVLGVVATAPTRYASQSKYSILEIFVIGIHYIEISMITRIYTHLGHFLGAIFYLLIFLAIWLIGIH